MHGSYVGLVESTRSPTASLKILLHSRERPKIRSMLPKSSTNVTRPGANSFTTTRLLPRIVFQCMFFFTFSMHVVLICFFCPDSRNVTIQNTPGFLRRDDPSYTSLPPDSRQHPAPVDPSSKILSTSMPALANVRSLQVVLHLFGSGLEYIFRIVLKSQRVLSYVKLECEMVMRAIYIEGMIRCVQL